MKRYAIYHETAYGFSAPVALLPHTIRVRPREGHELRIESSSLTLNPPGTIIWQRDAEGNSVATASFCGYTSSLVIASRLIIQKYDQTPYEFRVADYAVGYPFVYREEQQILLFPYMEQGRGPEHDALGDWVRAVWQSDKAIESFNLLLLFAEAINRQFSYRMREAEGIQAAEETLRLGSGSCRDFACLFIAAVRRLGFAARFVSGYIYFDPTTIRSGTTHAWAEVFIPGAGWKGVDPTIGKMAGSDHIAVAAVRRPEDATPVAGSFIGAPGASMTVNVQVVEQGEFDG